MPAQGRKLCWLVPDDRGGGVVSVAISCCRQALLAGQDPTLLMLLAPTGHISEHVNFRLSTLNVEAPGIDAPEKIVHWLNRNPQDVLFINSCEQADVIIPYIPAATRGVYVVHDSAPPYWKAAVRHERALDSIVAVSRTVADAFRHRLREPERLRVIHNGTLFPDDTDLPRERPADIVFLGSDQPVKGAYDVIRLWPFLLRRGFSGRLHWFGDLSPAFVEAIASLPRSSDIVLHGRAMRSEIFRQAVSARVLLMLSRAEPFGMATIECMGMGCLPVAWDVASGTKEIVEPNCRFFAPLGNYERLADQVLAACEVNPAIREQATRRARLEFGEPAVWRRYEALIDGLMELPPVMRACAGEKPPLYKPRLRLFQLLPARVRAAVHGAISRSSRLGYWLRNFRGI